MNGLKLYSYSMPMEIYYPSLLSRRVSIPMTKMGGSIQQVIIDSLSKLEGKCGEEGYIKRGSIQIFNYSCGIIKGPNIIIDAVFRCDVSNPVPDQEFDCIVEHNTRAGIKARLHTREDSPFIVFLARDHHYMIPRFSDIKEKEHIRVKILGQRFEINDPKISVIATLVSSEEQEPDPEESETEQEGGNTPNKPDILVLTDSIKKPGNGPGEHVTTQKKYGKLDKHLQWRQRLCPFDHAEFECNGSPTNGVVFKNAKWNTLEHFRHACIVYLHDPVLALTFCAGGKNGESPHNLESKYKHIPIHDTWDTIQQEVMYIGLESQFGQHPNKKTILKDTLQAELICPVQGRLWYYERLRVNLFDNVFESIIRAP